jgi:hypothetical protein
MGSARLYSLEVTKIETALPGRPKFAPNRQMLIVFVYIRKFQRSGMFQKEGFTMKMKICIAAGLAALFLCLPSVSVAREQSPSDIYSGFNREQMAQMLAPIALYPDALLAQILMASTYPIEVVEAARWVKQNPTLNGAALDDALKEKEWDVSVKSLTHFPLILARMNAQIGETSMLGNAFLDQQADVMDTIQKLRVSARAAGNLETTREQTVIADEAVIRIEPANPRVIYVPAYSPSLVYGTWWYPAYPPFAAWYPIWYPPTGFVTFSSGLWVGAAIGWCDFSWHHRTVNVYHHHTRRFYTKDHFRRRNYRPGPYAWRHNPVHRRGVSHRARSTSRRLSRPDGMSAQSRRAIHRDGPKGPDRATRTRQRSPFNRSGIDSLQKLQGVNKQNFHNQRKFKHKQTPAGAKNRQIPHNSPLVGQGNFRGKGQNTWGKNRPVQNVQNGFNRKSSNPAVKNKMIPKNFKAPEPNIAKHSNRKSEGFTLKKEARSGRSGYSSGTTPWQKNDFTRGNSTQSRWRTGNGRSSRTRTWP